MSPSYSTLDRTCGACASVVVILMHPRWISLIINCGYYRNYRVVWVQLTCVCRWDLGTTRVYASNMPRERMELWDEIGANDSTNCRWIVANNFHMVKTREDKIERQIDD